MTDRPSDRGLVANNVSPNAALRSLDFGAVRWTDGFWADRFRQIVEVTLPYHWRRMHDVENAHVVENLRIAAGLAEGEFKGTNWHDAWAHKWIETASVVYEQTRDPKLLAQMDELIGLIAQAQETDGWIATQTTVRGRERYLTPNHHEIYVMGHLMTAACVHRRITGQSNYLDLARRAADYLWETFKDRPPRLAHFPVNPSNIMGAVELYRTTGERRYLDEAMLFIGLRGSIPGGSAESAGRFNPRGGAYRVGGTDVTQDRVPLREETQVVGHAVWFTYLYAGAADAYMETGDETLLVALERLWIDLNEAKIGIGGGVCPIHHGLSVRGDEVWEAAGAPYDLPNATAYNETCGQVGNVMWNWRMLLITGDGRYADALEHGLYNVLSGVSLSGDRWFYTNALRWYGQEHPLLSQDNHGRFEPGLVHICCPTNLMRLVASAQNYALSVSGEGLWCHLYGAATIDARLPDGRMLRLAEETDYPWDGLVTLTVREAPPDPLTLNLRIPAWAIGASVTVNGEPWPDTPLAGAYLPLQRIWREGDRVRLKLPMRVRVMEAHPWLEQACGQVAVMRGPLLYCLEGHDLPDGVRVSEVRLPRDVRFRAVHQPDLLMGVTVLEGEALAADEGDWSGQLYRELRPELRPVAIRLIPYYAWANRGEAPMTVWMPLV